MLCRFIDDTPRGQALARKGTDSHFSYCGRCKHALHGGRQGVIASILSLPLDKHLMFGVWDQSHTLETDSSLQESINRSR